MNKFQNVPERISSIIDQVLEGSGLDGNDFLLGQICQRTGSYVDIDDQMCVQYLCLFIQQRWQEIKGSANSYVVNPHSFGSRVYIAVAKFLVQEKLVEYTHYYPLIMPSVKNFEILSSVYFQKVTDCELENLLLSDDEYLLDVGEILDDFKATGKLRLQTINAGMRSLTVAEMKRIAEHPSEEIAAQFRNLLSRYKPRNLGLTKQTVEAVWRLACGVTRSGGGHSVYNTYQNSRSYQAVITFQEYLDTMPSQERAALFSYLITRPESLGSLPSTFAEIWHRMTVDQECIYGIGKYYHKLAFDFFRDYAHCNIFNTVSEVLKLQDRWRVRQPEVLEFVSPAMYVDTPENNLALQKVNVIEYDITFRNWDDNGKIPPTVYNVIKLIENERKQQYPNWEGVLCKALKLFKHQALKKLSPFWDSQDTHNWYRRFLNDDYLNQFIQVADETEYSDDEPVPYSC